MRVETFVEKKEGPIILWMTYPHRGNEKEALLSAIADAGITSDFSLHAVFVDDWNKDLSPWAFSGEAGDFSGGGSKTLSFLENQVLPAVLDDKTRKVYIMGYSLAGLFSLWALLESNLFEGAICASSSFWYKDFLSWLEEKTKETFIRKKIYLSLGGKEKNTPNKLMATIEDCTKMVEQLLKKDNEVMFEMNPGGHFADSGKRLVKGIRWILKTKQMIYHGEHGWSYEG